MDGYHHSLAYRWKKGPLSAEGYYEDAYDFQAFVTNVLSPLGPSGDGRFKPRIIDLAADQPIDEPPVMAPSDAVLIVDGSKHPGYSSPTGQAQEPGQLQPSAEMASVLPEFSITASDLPDSDVHVVALHGNLDIVSAGGVADALVKVAGSTVVVDLSGLKCMDCSGIDALVAAETRILVNGMGQLVVTRPNAIVRRALEIMGLGGWIMAWSPEWDRQTFRVLQA